MKNESSKTDIKELEALRETIRSMSDFKESTVRIALKAASAIASVENDDGDKEYANTFVQTFSMAVLHSQHLTADERDDLWFALGWMAANVMGLNPHGGPQLSLNVVRALRQLRSKQRAEGGTNKGKNKVVIHDDLIKECFAEFHGGGIKPKRRNWLARTKDAINAQRHKQKKDPVDVGTVRDRIRQIGLLP